MGCAAIRTAVPLRQPPRVEISVRRLPSNTLGVLIRAKLPEDIHVRVQFFQVTIPRNSFGNGASSKEIEIRGFVLKNTGERAMGIFLGGK